MIVNLCIEKEKKKYHKLKVKFESFKKTCKSGCKKRKLNVAANVKSTY